MTLNGNNNHGNKASENAKSMNGQGDELPHSMGVSKVLFTEILDQNEKKITIEIPLLDGSMITVTGTLGEIVKIRKELELNGKILSITKHDYETINTLKEIEDLTRWEYKLAGGYIIDTKAEREKKKQSELKQKKLVEDLKQSIRDGHATLISTGVQSKKALFEVFIVSEEKIKHLFSKKTMIKTGKVLSKTGDAIGDFIEQGIYYIMPTIEGTLPEIKKQIYMTGKQLLDILNGKKVVSNSSAKKEDIKQTDGIQ